MDNLRAEGMTIVVIAHRPNILKHVDKILVLKDGIMQEFGPRDDVMMKLQGVQRALPGPGNQSVQVKKNSNSADAPSKPAKNPAKAAKVRNYAASSDIKVSEKYAAPYREPMKAPKLHKTNGVHLNGNAAKPTKRAAVLTMGPSEKIKAKIQSLTPQPLTDADISKIYSLFVKGDQEGALKYIEEIKR
jgi:ABC-type multidrug transport system ATPase subunit